jgi:hypothetical protein
MESRTMPNVGDLLEWQGSGGDPYEVVREISVDCIITNTGNGIMGPVSSLLIVKRTGHVEAFGVSVSAYENGRVYVDGEWHSGGGR